MRGWLTVTTRENSLSTYRTGILVASAEPELVKIVHDHIRSRFPVLDLAFLAPSSYGEFLVGLGQRFWIDEMKRHPARSLSELRKHEFDLAFVLLDGRPTFRKAKIAAFLLNSRRVIIYTGDGNSIVVDRAHWKALLQFWHNRGKAFRLGSVLFIPFGFLYLLARTVWLCRRRQKVNRPATNDENSAARPLT